MSLPAPEFDHLVTNVEDVLREYTEVDEIQPEPFIGPLNRTSEDPVQDPPTAQDPKDPNPTAQDPKDPTAQDPTPTHSLLEIEQLSTLLTKIQTTMKLFEEHAELLRTDLRDIYCEMVVFLKKDSDI